MKEKAVVTILQLFLTSFLVCNFIFRVRFITVLPTIICSVPHSCFLCFLFPLSLALRKKRELMLLCLNQRGSGHGRVCGSL